MQSPSPVAASFLTALRERNVVALASCLHPGVQLRALQPGGVIVQRGASAVAGRIAAWLSGGTTVELVQPETWEAGGRLIIAYQIRLHDDDLVTEIQQHLHCDLMDHRFAAIDLLTTFPRSRRDG